MQLPCARGPSDAPESPSERALDHPESHREHHRGTEREARVPLFNKGWQDEREVVGIGVACDEVRRYKQQNQLNWFDHILTVEQWQGQEETFGRHSDNLGDVGAEFIKYQGTGSDWPDFLFGGDDYPGYPDNPILTLSEVDSCVQRAALRRYAGLRKIKNPVSDC